MICEKCNSECEGIQINDSIHWAICPNCYSERLNARKYLKRDDVRSYLSSEFYKWISEGLEENPNLLIDFATTKDLTSLHMHLGMYIRNHYIHSHILEEKFNIYAWDPDRLGSEILEFWHELAFRLSKCQIRWC